MDYDIIGDVHGHGDKLEALLRNMGYQETAGAWRHPTRMAIFVGDFVDRGPRQIDTVAIVRAMVEAGSALAVMGNHEMNAIGWVVPSEANPGQWLRTRSGAKGANNLHHHKEFLAQVGADSAQHAEMVEWFMTLPLWLDLPELRVVHACWHPKAIEAASRMLGGPYLKKELLQEALDDTQKPREDGSFGLFQAIEIICKGVEVPMPEGAIFVDPAGYARQQVRSRWWDPEAITFRSCAMIPEDQKLSLPDSLIPENCVVPQPVDKPVFFGHYWMKGAPKPLGKLLACVDYSVAKGGPLVAYRYSGEPELLAENFITSDPAPHPKMGR